MHTTSFLKISGAAQFDSFVTSVRTYASSAQ